MFKLPSCQRIETAFLLGLFKEFVWTFCTRDFIILHNHRRVKTNFIVKSKMSIPKIRRSAICQRRKKGNSLWLIFLAILLLDVHTRLNFVVLLTLVKLSDSKLLEFIGLSFERTTSLKYAFCWVLHFCNKN